MTDPAAVPALSVSAVAEDAVESVIAERDVLASSLAAMTVERDRMAAELDALAVERDRGIVERDDLTLERVKHMRSFYPKYRVSSRFAALQCSSNHTCTLALFIRSCNLNSLFHHHCCSSPVSLSFSFLKL